ncbi:hypothetical protein DMO17_10050 [Aquipseudomonas alcaligenes]|uniref:Uncharacterized protein n=1 Tax=Aquipseudomonas alcaligenes TaxID=43263 RepID=A0A2V4LXX5_AQUAC|nr:hypothetical protein [Pseudomonas alcaligenes]PYC25997.1 hypothetical protein DMO17_10050 [Pseudomonas alcaligenes]
MSKNLLSWMLFAVFVVLALGLHWHAQLLVFSGLVGAGKALVWLAWLAFVGYSIHCSRRENIVKSIRGMARLYWGRQIIIDLYLGVALFLALIALHQGALVMLAWLLPVLLFANQATLLYLAIHFESLLALLAN